MGPRPAEGNYVQLEIINPLSSLLESHRSRIIDIQNDIEEGDLDLVTCQRASLLVMGGSASGDGGGGNERFAGDRDSNAEGCDTEIKREAEIRQSERWTDE